jgi:hypothetical protein
MKDEGKAARRKSRSCKIIDAKTVSGMGREKFNSIAGFN